MHKHSTLQTNNLYKRFYFLELCRLSNQMINVLEVMYLTYFNISGNEVRKRQLETNINSLLFGENIKIKQQLIFNLENFFANIKCHLMINPNFFAENFLFFFIRKYNSFLNKAVLSKVSNFD